jgi:hypothetical protein
MTDEVNHLQTRSDLAHTMEPDSRVDHHDRDASPSATAAAGLRRSFPDSRERGADHAEVII